MPLPTSYILNYEQECKLVDHVMQRILDLQQQTGRDQVGETEFWKSLGNISQRDPLNRDLGPAVTFMGKRRLYELTYQNDVDHRAWTLGGIFAESNLTVPVSRRICKQSTAKGNEYFFATKPWFAALPVGEQDRSRADKTDRYLRWKMDKAHLRNELETDIERGFVIGEAVVKTRWRNEVQIFKEPATVLVDEQGKDILGADGDFITESDLWVPQVIVDPQTNEPIESGVMVLKRDNATAQPPTLIWEQKLVTRQRKIYNGPEAKVIHFLDFLCPLEAETVQKADCCIHLYDQSVMDIVDTWRKGTAGMGAEESVEQKRKMIELIQTLASSSSQPKSGQDTFGEDMQDYNSLRMANTSKGPTAAIAECYLRFDADGDGILEEIMVVLDRQSRTPIFYDYVANITPTGERPFSVIRPEAVPGRWYGRGAMESFEAIQNVVDLSANRLNLEQSASGRVTFWNPSSVSEGDANPMLKMGKGQTYTLKPGKKAEDALQIVYLGNPKQQDLFEMIQFYLQLANNESGVLNANDADASGLDTVKTATGVRNLTASGNTMFSLFISHMEPGIEDVLQKMVNLVMVNLDETEVYTYFETGENGEGSGELVKIAPSQISDMDINVQVLLTRFRGEQVLATSDKAIQVIQTFYAQPYEVQIATRQFFVDQLRALQVSDAEKKIIPVQVQQVDPKTGQPIQQQAQAAPTLNEQTPS